MADHLSRKPLRTTLFRPPRRHDGARAGVTGRRPDRTTVPFSRRSIACRLAAAGVTASDRGGFPPRKLAGLPILANFGRYRSFDRICPPDLYFHGRLPF